MERKKSTTTAEFSAQYKDPGWQKKRLEVMERDKFSCARCGDNESTLNVHHSHYTKGTKIWEYSNRDLLTMCESCHKEVHRLMDQVNHWLIPEIISNYRHYKEDDGILLENLHDLLVIIYTQGASGYEGRIIKAVLSSYRDQIIDEQEARGES